MFSLLLIACYLLLFLFLSFKNIKWAIYLIVFTLPTYLIRFQLGPLPLTLLEGEILILFLVWLIKSLKYKNISARGGSASGGKTLNQLLVTNYQLLIPLILFLLSATVAIFISPNLREAAGIWKAYFIEPILFFVIFIKTIKKEDLKFVFMFLCFNVLLLSLLAIYQKFTGAFIANSFWAEAATRRVTSVFPYPNALALYLAPIITVLIGLIVSKCQSILGLAKRSGAGKCQRKNITLLLYYFITFITGFFAIYFTHSKGALIGILAGLLFYAIFFKPYRKYFIGILILIPLILYSFNPDLNLKGNATVAGGDSISTRLDMWEETWQMLKTKPILGAGLAGYQAAVAPFHKKSYIEVYLYPHNIFFNFWSEIGLLGLLAFIGIIIYFYKLGCDALINNKNKTIIHNSLFIIPVLTAMTTLLVHGLVDVPYFKNDLAILFWLIVSCETTILMAREHKR
ncbi:MAG TPA: O-antigen ligase family protein [bacterium]|nr:O-antigen ligase family protein [bacterium]HPL95424.1 O-antigen ligase family protein [bacterium]